MTGDDFLLEESSDAKFSAFESTKVSNINTSTLTGLENGSYFYRIKNGNNEISNVVEVIVQHHSLEKAFLFFALGLVLFLCLVVTLSLGHIKTKNQPARGQV